MNNTKRFFRQIIYTEDLNDSTIRGLFKTLAERILADFRVIYDSVEFKLQTILEPESEKDLIIKQNKFPTFASIIEALGTRQKNKFYPANPSLWVVFVSCFIGILIIIFVSVLHSQDFITVAYKQFGVAIVGSILCLTFWVSLFYKEKVYGYHTDLIRNNITLSFWIFLFTEGLCFMSLFWTFFHSLLAASTHIGQFAPGDGIVNYYFDEDVIMHPYWSVYLFTDMSNSEVYNFPDNVINKYTYDHTLTVKFHFNLFDCGQLIDPYGYPALNTALLLISATILNSGHAKLKMGKYLKSFLFLALTLLFGVVFMCVQFLEIKSSTLQYNDGIYACSFYSLTGLHGIHVILGVFALFLCFINFMKGNYTRKRHDTFWCAVAYWHFVDVVWVLVYLLIYCWPSCLYFSDDIRYSYLGYKDYCLNINTEVFEKKFFEKIVHKDFDLIGEIVSLYTSKIALEASASILLKDLLSSTEQTSRIRNRQLYQEYYSTIESAVIPLLTRDEEEENDYSGFGNYVQDEFCSKTLRQSKAYNYAIQDFMQKELIVGTAINIEEVWNLYLKEEKKKWLENKEKDLLLVHDSMNEKDNLSYLFYKKSSILEYRKENSKFISALQSFIPNQSFNIEEEKKISNEFLALYFHSNKDLPRLFNNEFWQKKYFFSNDVFAVLGNPDPGIVHPELVREKRAKDLFRFRNHTLPLKGIKQSFIDYANINQELNKVIHPDYINIIIKVLTKDEFFDDVHHSRNNKKTAGYTSDFPVIRSFLQNKYYLPYMKPKNDVSLEEQVFLMLDLYEMRQKRVIFKKPIWWQESLQTFLKNTDLEGDAFIIEYLKRYFKRLQYLGINPFTDDIHPLIDFSTHDDNALYGFNTAATILGIDNSTEKTPLEADLAFKRWKEIVNLDNSAEIGDDIQSSQDSDASILEECTDIDLCEQSSENIFEVKTDEIKERELLQNEMEKLFAEGTLLNDLNFFNEANYLDDDNRRRDCLALLPIENNPKTLSEALAKEGRRDKAAVLLAFDDWNYEKALTKSTGGIVIPSEFLYGTQAEIEKTCKFYPKWGILGEVPCFVRAVQTGIFRGEPAFKAFEPFINILHLFGHVMTDYEKKIFEFYDVTKHIEELEFFIYINHEHFSKVIDDIINDHKDCLNRIINLKKNEVDIHLVYFEMYETRKYINYSEIKSDKHLYAVFLNILHTVAFDYLHSWAISDLTTWKGKIKFPILFVLYHININWAFTFAARFTPYLLTSDFKLMWGDLLYTRKPKWVLKKN